MKKFLCEINSLSFTDERRPTAATKVFTSYDKSKHNPVFNCSHLTDNFEVTCNLINLT
jgi:hypothetical protein